MTTVNPYLTFDGNCEEAFNFYKSVFGGEFIPIVRIKDVPSEQPVPEGEGEKIMHVSLPIGQGTILMASDRPETFGPLTMGDNFSISINPESEEEATDLFNGLSVGGRVTMPLQKTFWNAYFGMFTDKFGIQWMVNYDYGQQK
ncbi:MAG: VOC family protein [Nitrosospira sp.]